MKPFLISTTTTLVLLLSLSATPLLGANQNPLSSYNDVYGWNQLDYKFPSNQTRTRQLTTKEFIVENNVITGIKIKGSRMFLTVPRWREGVPSTLNYVEFSLNQKGTDVNQEIPNGALLIPYPSWEMNQLGNCNALQYIQSMEIDQFNRMWVIDVGRVNIFTTPDNKCPPKLVLIDLDKNEILQKYEFPSDVVSRTNNFLNDLAVGCTTKDECFAYITDALDSKIIVYDLKDNRSWFVHHSSMNIDQDATIIPILGNNYTFNTNIDGIALSPKDSNFDRVYFCPLSSFNLFSVPTSILKTAVNGITLGDSNVKDHGRKSSQSDGLAMDSKGLLFFGLLSSNGVSYFNTSLGSLDGTNEVLLVQSDADLQWVDTFAFDEAGNLFAVTNRLQLFGKNEYDFNEINFRVVTIFTGANSYMQTAKDNPNDKETISPALIDATPGTNLDPTTPMDAHNIEHPKNKYDTPEMDKNEDINAKDKEQPKSESNKSEDSDFVKNSSMALDVYTGTLVFVLATYVFHPAI